jgi:hypothetical protein
MTAAGPGGEVVDEAGEMAPEDDEWRRSIPEIRLPVPESEDVADNPLDTLAPREWAGRTNAAAAQAQSRASRLASRLGSSRTNSGTTSPLMANLSGKHSLVATRKARVFC